MYKYIPEYSSLQCCSVPEGQQVGGAVQGHPTPATGGCQGGSLVVHCPVLTVVYYSNSLNKELMWCVVAVMVGAKSNRLLFL